MEADRIDITAQLFALQDKVYTDFQSKLLPTVPREAVIGVRTPDLRKMAKQICKTNAASKKYTLCEHNSFFFVKILHMSKICCTFAADFKSNGYFGNGDYKFLSV